MNDIILDGSFLAKHQAIADKINADYKNRNRKIVIQFVATAALGMVATYVVFKIFKTED